MAPWKRILFKCSPILTIASILSFWLYFALRIRFTLDAQKVAGKTFSMAWVFISIELGVIIPIFLHTFWSLFILKSRSRPKLRLQGDVVPTVDVLVTCCGEDVDVILDTARAACSVDYPLTSFRVIVLDDGRSLELKGSVEILREQFPNLHYRSREKIPGVPHHFKAGNLNYGLEECDKMKDGPGEYIAALDADMIPEREWLRAIMAHMVMDGNCAMACPPQVGSIP
jgi:cellulose synthase/poly-beta-1,6-N-acetylglucosamine synthase-like glycosyltransferase